MDQEQPTDPTSFSVVGIGASAGGIEALKAFFTHVAPDSGMAYVVILHLSPDHDSQLAAVLQSVTTMPVQQVTQRVQVEPNHVYVVPPNQHLLMDHGMLSAATNMLIEDRRAPVDIFFRTLAESHGARAVCVVLSGTGANGSMGLKRVKERGGAAFVQNPREAAFNEMPRNAIATDLVDDVLPVADIPGRIALYNTNLANVIIPAEPEQRSDDQQQALREVFVQLRRYTGHDFSNYKRPTILRRIERRIIVCDLPDLPTYAALLREQPDEVQALLKDLLISVTNFFRDREAFNLLEEDVLPKLLRNKSEATPLRIWVVGCATGEEAYSLAMLCSERMQNVGDAPTIQIFATDIDNAALTHAREGLYTINDAADVSPERLRRFFSAEGDLYRVRREIREMVLFANHNVLKDPPFSHLDLVTCRNMLIYFNHTAQERTLETLHFALNPGGFLFLGMAESIDNMTDLYAPVSREHHIYQSRQASGRIYPVPDTQIPTSLATSPMRSPTLFNNQQAMERITYSDLHQRLLEAYAPPSVLVNEAYDIVHMSEQAGRYMQVGGGEPSVNILKLVRPELRLELRSALYQAVQRQTNVETANLSMRIDDRLETITLVVRPVLRQDDTARGFLLVVFAPSTGIVDVQEAVFRSDEPMLRQMEDEVQRVRAQLRLSSEQYEFQAEELKAANEELQALNEELRSAVEELETSKEELQSINEELRTVNQELKIKIDETTHTSNNLQNLVNSTNIGTIFLDRSFRVVLFTPAARDIFNLIPADYGRPLSDITNRLVDVDVSADAEAVLATLQSIEREVHITGNRTLLMRVQPYRTADDRINGVVITMLDITERQQAEVALRESEAKYRMLFNSIDEAFALCEILTDRHGVAIDYRMLELNPAFEKMMGISPEAAQGRTARELIPGIEDWWIETYSKVALRGETIRFENTIASLNRWFDIYAAPSGEHGNGRFVLVFQDITERKQTEAVLQVNAARQAFLLRLNDALRPLARADEIQAVASRILGEQLRADRVYYAEVDSDGAHMVVPREYYSSSAPFNDAENHRTVDLSASVLRAVRSGQLVAIRDTQQVVEDSDAEHGAYRAVEIGALIAYPLVKDHMFMTILGVTCATPRAWTDEDLALVQETAERTWNAVERARAETALRESEALLQRTNEGLEVRVEERTGALNTMNGQLQQEIVERIHIEIERSALLQRLVSAQEDERQRIARELHDSLGQVLTGLNLHLASAQALPGTTPELQATLNRVRSITAKIDQEVDRLTMELRPPALSDMSLIDAVASYVQEWSIASGIPADIVPIKFDPIDLPDAVETTVYRIVQESLTNVLKHAQASQISIILEQRDGILRTIIEDNGIGFVHDGIGKDDGSGQRLGLIGMEERAMLAGGRLSLESELGQGTTVYLELPLPPHG